MLLVGLLPAGHAAAQEFTGPSWQGYDSTFYVGSDVPGNVDTAMDGLTIDYAWNYSKTITDWLNGYHTPQNIADTAHRDFVQRAYERGFKIIIGPKWLQRLTESAPVIENYSGGTTWAKADNGIRLPPLTDNTAATVRQPLNDREVFFTLNAERDIVAGSQQMAGNPCYTIQAFENGGGDVYSLLGETDRTNDIRVSFAMWTDTTDFVDLDVTDADTLAYAVILRREIAGQSDTCKCAIWERFDTLFITGSLYKGGAVITPEGFREIGRVYGMDTIATSLRAGTPVPPNKGNWFGWTNLSANVPNQDTCTALFATLSADRFDSGYVVDRSDLIYEFHTTGLVPVRLLRGKVNPVFYDELNDGIADDLIAATVDSMTADPVLDSVTWRVSITNEIKPLWEYRAYGTVAARLLGEIADNGRQWQLHVNPYQDYGALRALSGDMDSTGVRLIQSMVPQPYTTPPVPVMYADTARMDPTAAEQYFGGKIRFNTITDYELFTSETAAQNAYRLDRDYSSGSLQNWVQAVDVARFRFRQFAPSYPVIPSIQGQGHYPIASTSGDVTRDFGQPSPEYAKEKLWYALACGADGVHLADANWSAYNYGYIHAGDGLHSADSLEYGSLPSPNPAVNFTTRVTWLGIRSRFDTIQQTLAAIRTIDNLIGWKHLIYNQEQVSAFDVGQSPATLPLVDSILAKHSQRYALDGNGAFVDSAAYDARDSTYLEVTHFASGDGDTTDWEEETHYYLILNKRIWPIDTVFADTVVTYNGDTIARNRSPLGYIDVRKPVLRFQNRSSRIADRVVIEGILSGFRDTAYFGDLAELSWLKPGSAELYRVTVLPTLLSDMGTAYNNAVRSENPSSDGRQRDRIAVYERDSVVWLRTVDSLGNWSTPLMLSDEADTVTANGKRVASNMLPSMATSRNNARLTRVVWERLDSAGLSSVESVLIQADPINRITLDTAVLTRQTLMASVPLEGPENLAPSIVGVSDTGGVGGFVVAWAGPDSGVVVMAIRDSTLGGGSLDSKDTTAIYRIHSTDLDSLCRYATVAHRPEMRLINILGSSTQKAGTPPPNVGVGTYRWYNLVHLAYQQGDDDESLNEHINYHRVGAYFPAGTAPGLLVGEPERVDWRLSACSFVHPSIAADSVRVGVAFEIIESSATQRNIGLRFRDTAQIVAAMGYWGTTLYRWGGPLKKSPPWYQVGSIYERPSLTEFPVIGKSASQAQPEGGLTWFWRDDPDNRAFPQFLYRFGQFGSREIGDGKHPGMTLVPAHSGSPFNQTSVFHRLDDSSRVLGLNDVGTPVYRYGGQLLNTPGNPLGYFSTITGDAGIVAEGTVIGYPESCPPYRKMDFGFSFSFDPVTHGQDDVFGPGDPIAPNKTPGLPPSFFAVPGETGATVDTLADAHEVVRSGLFVAGNDPVKIRTLAAGGDSLTEWLNAYGLDTERGNVPANVWVVPELVRASDSVVLWAGDSISARELDTLDDPIDELLSVPVDQVADSGTLVFIRMNAFATLGVTYKTHAGFRFFTVDSTGGFLKMVTPHDGPDDTAEPRPGDAGLAVRVIPNPARDRAEVRIRIRSAGRVALTVWSTTGDLLAQLPELNADGAGEYTITINLAAVRTGAYLLRADQGGESTTARFSVVR